MRGAQTGRFAGEADDGHTRRVFLLIAASVATAFATAFQLGVGYDPPDSMQSANGSDPGTFGYGGTAVQGTITSTGTASPTTSSSATGSGGSGGAGGGGGGGGASTSGADYGYQGYGQYGYGGVVA